MTDAPERIWALSDRRKTWQEMPPEEGQTAWNWTEYTRADLPKPRVKPLVWTHHPCGEMAANGTGSAYIIDKRDKPRFRWLKWPNGHGPERERLDEMKTAAQADYEARVLACLETGETLV